MRLFQLTFTRTVLFSRFLLIAISVSGCEQVPPEYKQFFALHPDQQKEAAEKFPVEKQIDYYLAEQRYVRPPSTILRHVIAKRGKEALPALLERIKKVDHDYEKVALLRVFYFIHVRYDLREEKEALEQLKEVVSKMKDADRKAWAKETLKDIIEDRPPRKYGESP